MKWKGRRESNNVEDRRDEARPVDMNMLRGQDTRAAYERQQVAKGLSAYRQGQLDRMQKPKPKPADPKANRLQTPRPRPAEAAKTDRLERPKKRPV